MGTIRHSRSAWIAGIGALCAMLALPACTSRASTMPADKAFALSASALSGRDRYGFVGEVSIFDPTGVMAGQSRYQGEVTGHGNLNLKWTGGRSVVQARAEAGPPAFKPLQLLDAVAKHSAAVSYADRPFADGNVRLRVKLTDAAARKRVADGLRAELSDIRSGVNRKRLGPAQRKHADAALARAERQLGGALSTLRVKTVCVWTANRKTWFPRQMSEETELTYQWNGKTYREQRVSHTNFLPGGSNGTITK